ncbi:unnamed protein product [Clavelina lepadiformis]|uniref:Uncharacterized protein n=1 Tax=Clavelina lepadiformis TaxID=159417 RepID=A0ABP0FW48_CLALP
MTWFPQINYFCWIMVFLCTVITETKQSTSNEKFWQFPNKTEVCYGGQNGEYKIQTCSNKEEMCITTFSINKGSTTIEKACVEAETCSKLEGHNLRLCKNFRTEDSTCHFCCVGNRCNNLEKIEEFEHVYQLLSNISIKH